MNLGLTDSHLESASYEQWMEIDMQDLYLDKFFTYWKKFHEEILEYYVVSNEVKLYVGAYNELHMVEYSELKSDLIGEVTKIVKFLGLPMTRYIEECILKNPDGSHKRLKNISWTDYLIKMGKIDQSFIKLSKRAYEEIVQKFKNKLIKM